MHFRNYARTAREGAPWSAVRPCARGGISDNNHAISSRSIIAHKGQVLAGRQRRSRYALGALALSGFRRIPGGAASNATVHEFWTRHLARSIYRRRLLVAPRLAPAALPTSQRWRSQLKLGHQPGLSGSIPHKDCRLIWLREAGPAEASYKVGVLPFPRSAAYCPKFAGGLGA